MLLDLLFPHSFLGVPVPSIIPAAWAGLLLLLLMWPEAPQTGLLPWRLVRNSLAHAPSLGPLSFSQAPSSFHSAHWAGLLSVCCKALTLLLLPTEGAALSLGMRVGHQSWQMPTVRPDTTQHVLQFKAARTPGYCLPGAWRPGPLILQESIKTFPILYSPFSSALQRRLILRPFLFACRWAQRLEESTPVGMLFFLGFFFKTISGEGVLG